MRDKGCNRDAVQWSLRKSKEDGDMELLGEASFSHVSVYDFYISACLFFFAKSKKQFKINWKKWLLLAKQCSTIFILNQLLGPTMSLARCLPQFHPRTSARSLSLCPWRPGPRMTPRRCRELCDPVKICFFALDQFGWILVRHILW